MLAVACQEEKKPALFPNSHPSGGPVGSMLASFPSHPHLTGSLKAQLLIKSISVLIHYLKVGFSALIALN